MLENHAQPGELVATTRIDDGMLDIAVIAAREGRGEDFFSALTASRVLHALRGYFRKKDLPLDDDDVESCIVEAIASLYRKARTRVPILKPRSYLWKSAENSIIQVYRARQHEDNMSDEEMESAQLKCVDRLEPGQIDLAINYARSVLVRLGRGTMRRVFTYVLDRMEEGAADVPNEEICSALDLSPDAVRQTLSRGYRKLAEIASAEGKYEETLEVSQ